MKKIKIEKLHLEPFVDLIDSIGKVDKFISLRGGESPVSFSQGEFAPLHDLTDLAANGFLLQCALSHRPALTTDILHGMDHSRIGIHDNIGVVGHHDDLAA